MKLKMIELLRIGLVLIFSGVGIWLTLSLFQDVTGWFILAIGLVGGFVGTEFYYVPTFREKWKRIGVPGYEKTDKQLKAVEDEKKKTTRP